MQSIERIKQKIFVLKNYDRVFRGEVVRQKLPECCGQRLDLDVLLFATVTEKEIEIGDDRYKLFEVTCPTCGKVISPEWDVR